MLEGRSLEQKQQNRLIAGWMSPVLTALSGQAITPAQLLGEEASEMSVEQKIREGEKKVRTMLRKIAKLNKKTVVRG